MAVYFQTGVVLVSILSCIASTHAAFEGYEFLTVKTKTIDHVQFIQKLTEDFVDLDVWRDATLNMTGRILVPPGILDIVKQSLTNAGIEWTIDNVDLPKMVAEATAKNTIFRGKATSDIVDHYNYHTYDKLESYLYSLRDEYKGLMELFYLNHMTHEGRRVIAVRLSADLTISNKQAIIGEAGIHAREWVTPAATIYVIEKMLQGYRAGSNDAVGALQSYDWYFVPSTNPDGYDFSHQHSNNRLWRKNRRQISNRCVGVDLNRNFDIYHGTTGVSSSCSSDIYPGNHGFSEPETANIRDLFKDLEPRLVSYLSIHSYSQYLLVPWGYVLGVSRPDNSEELDRVAMLMASSIRQSDGKVYLVGTAYELLQYAASGASEDWAHSQKGSLYSYCYELRPDAYDSRGFLLPPNEIVPTGRELLASLYVLSREMK